MCRENRMIKASWPRAAAISLLGLLCQADATVAQDAVDYERIPTRAYSIIAEVRAKPGKEKELRDATLPLIDLVRGDPKNLVYVLQENREVPGHFVFYEIFQPHGVGKPFPHALVARCNVHVTVFGFEGPVRRHHGVIVSLGFRPLMGSKIFGCLKTKNSNQALQQGGFHTLAFARFLSFKERQEDADGGVDSTQ